MKNKIVIKVIVERTFEGTFDDIHGAREIFEALQQHPNPSGLAGCGTATWRLNATSVPIVTVQKVRDA